MFYENDVDVNSSEVDAMQCEPSKPYFLSHSSALKEKLLSLRDDGFYPQVIFPYYFTSQLDLISDENAFLRYCRQIEGDLPCLQQLREPNKPSEPRKEVVPETHTEYVLGSFWTKFDWSYTRKWLIVAFLLAFSITFLFSIESSLTLGKKVLSAFLSFVIFSLPLLLSLVNERKKVREVIPYSKDEIEYLKQQEEKKYAERIKDYAEHLRQYEEDLNRYQEAMKERENLMRKYTCLYLSWFLQSSFMPSEKYSVVDNVPLKGRSEDRLFAALMGEMPQRVHIDTVIGGYYPDIMVSADNDVYIDIEIDEPYEMETKKEIHYLGCDDEIRNFRLSQKEWLIVRFSEKQVIRGDCKSIINDLLGIVHDGSFTAIEDLLRLRDLMKEKRWSKEEARMMAIQNYRKDY